MTGGTLTIDPATLINSGTLEADGGELDLTGETVTNTGSLQAVNHGTLQLTDTTVTNTDGVTGDPFGTVTVGSGSTLEMVRATIGDGTITDNGTIEIRGSSTINNASLNNGGVTIDGGQTLTLDNVAVNGTTFTDTATGATIQIDGDTTLTLDDGATITGGTVMIGTAGTLEVNTALGATFDNVSVVSAGAVQVDAGSALDLNGATISGGSVNISATGSIAGFGTISDAIVNYGTLEAKGGTFDITGAISGTGSAKIDQGAELELGGASAQDVMFAGSAATLKLDDPTHFTGNITNLAVGDIIDLANIAVVSTTLSGSLLTVNEQNGQTLTFHVSGALLENDFHIQSDNNGGSDLVLTADPVAEAPTLAVSDAIGAENSPISLSIAPALTADIDPDASLSLTITGIPADARLSNVHETLSVTNGSISFTAEQLAAGVLTGLAITPASADEPGFTLQVTATNTDGAALASTSHDLLVSVTPVAEAPVLAVSDATGAENSPISLSIAPALTADIDPDASLSLTITGIPADATLSNALGTLSVTNGSISFTAAQLAAGVLTGLAITPTSADEPSFTLHVTATNTDGAALASTSHDLLVSVTPVAEAPVLAVSDATGAENSAISLSIAPALTADIDPDASLSLTITGIPADATLSNALGTLSVTNGSISFTAAQLAAGVLTGLAITPTSADEPSFTLQVTATNTDGAALASTSHDLLVNITPVADVPVVTVSATPINEGGTSTLTLALANAVGLFENSDDSVTVTVTLNHGATLHGAGVTDNGNGIFTLIAASASDLNGLTITPTSEFEGTVSVGVSAVTHDGTAVSTAGTTSTTLTVNPVADQPVVTASATTINDEGTSALTLTLTNAASLFEDSDDSVTVTVTLNHGATLHGTGVIDNHDGTFTLTATSAAGLNGLTITPASEFSGTVTVGVSAVTHDGTAVSTAGTTSTTLTVTPTNDLLVTLSGSAVAGTSIQVTGVTDGGTAVSAGLSYIWEVSNSADGHTGWTTVGTTASYTPTEANEGKYLQLVVNYTDAAGAESATDFLGAVAAPSIKTWKGGTHLWEVAGQWSPSGAPTASNDVLINLPVINSDDTETLTIDQNAFAHSFTENMADAKVEIISGATLTLGGNLTVSAGKFQIDSGGTLKQIAANSTISGSFTDNGTVEVTAGNTLEVASTGVSGKGIFKIDAGATLQLDHADSLNVVFAGSGELILKDPTHFTGTISDSGGSLGSGDVLDLAGFDATASVTYSGTTAGGTVTVSEANHVSAILHVGANSTHWTQPVSDGHGGILIHDPPDDGSPPMGNGGDVPVAHAVTADTSVSAAANLWNGRGAGSDQFVFSPNFGKDTIADFPPGTESIPVDHHTFASVAALLGGAQSSVPDVVITADAYDAITLKNASLSQLTSHQGDFHIT